MKRIGRLVWWGVASSVLVVAVAAVPPGCAAPKDGDTGQAVSSTGAPASKPKPQPKSNLPAPAKSATGSPTAPISATDPCATRLHDLCGPLLHYYALNRRLPESVEELQALAGMDPAAIAFECPVSKRPYVYVPSGFPLGDKPGFIVLHDAEPSHSGFRWAVVVEEPRGNQPLVTRVVAVPEPLFLGPARIPDDGSDAQD